MNKLSSPFKGDAVVTQIYGNKGNYISGYHLGLDVASIDQMPEIYGPGDGVIEHLVFENKSYGNYVIIRLSDKITRVLLAHMKDDSIKVKLGSIITEDTFIGIQGATGNTTGPHLHIQVHNGPYAYPASGLGNTLNPAELLGIKNQKGEVLRRYLNTLSDRESISPNAREAISWAISRGLIEGDESGNFNLEKALTREEFLVILKRYDNKKSGG